MTIIENANKITIRIEHCGEYFNANCQATIPEFFRAEVESGFEIEPPEWQHIEMYGEGDTEAEAIDTLRDQLRELGCAATRCKIIRDYALRGTPAQEDVLQRGMGFVVEGYNRDGDILFTQYTEKRTRVGRIGKRGKIYLLSSEMNN